MNTYIFPLIFPPIDGMEISDRRALQRQQRMPRCVQRQQPLLRQVHGQGHNLSARDLERRGGFDVELRGWDLMWWFFLG